MEEQQGQKRGREEAEDAPLLKRDGDAVYVELGGPTKRITVSKYKNTMLVHIREYYEKGGAMLPGKSGIALTLDKYAELKKALPVIDAFLAEGK